MLTVKVLIIHNRYQSTNTGGEDIVYDNELRTLRSLLGEDNVFTYVVSNDDLNKISLIFSIWFSRSHYKNVKKIIEQERIDLVHVHNFFPLLSPSVFKAARDCNAKVVHTLHNFRMWCISGVLYRDGDGLCELCTKKCFSLHGILNGCYRKSILQSAVTQFAFWFYKKAKFFDQIDYFFVLTNFQRKKIASFGIPEHRMLLKPNSLDIQGRKSAENTGYIYVGRLEESKGVHTLLQIWDTLDDKYVLTLVGGGVDEKELRTKYSKKNILFKGRCSREETFEHVARARFLVQPSVLYETFGLTMLEAMHFGVPVIGFDIGTRPDFIVNNINGFLCADENEFRVAIEKSYMLGESEYQIMSNNALVTAQSYDNSVVVRDQADMYQRIIDGEV